jgi:hypothetical protein
MVLVLLCLLAVVAVGLVGATLELLLVLLAE